MLVLCCYYFYVYPQTHAQVQVVRISEYIKLEDTLQIKQFLIHQTHEDFHFVSVQKTDFATCYTFQQSYHQLNIVNMQIRVIATEKKTFFVGNYVNTVHWDIQSEYAKRQIINSDLKEYFVLQDSVIGNLTLSVNSEGNPQFSYGYEQIDTYQTMKIFTNESGEITSIDDGRRYSGTDTTATAKIFTPDPITSSNSNYGGDYSDNNDSDNIYLNAQRNSVEMNLTFEDGIFYLSDSDLVIKDFASPTVEVITSDTAAFDFNRSENGFEDVNAFYHLSNFRNYISAIGFDSLKNFYIEIDTHGAGGADQSFFTGSSTLNIQYGEGGVDDAEDADVLIHEFGHALSYHASPESNSGLERRSIDEGYCDYFAASYSRSFSEYKWNEIFNWDGHNEFWSGRDANTAKHYPEDFSFEIYASSEIWSGALMDIFDALGKEVCDKIVCASLYFSYVEMTMPQAALNILAAEDLLYDGLYYEIIFSLLHARGLLYGVDIQDEKISPLSIYNTEGFTLRNEPLIIENLQEEPLNVQIINTEGVMLFSSELIGERNTFFPQLPSAGCYFLALTNSKHQLICKLIALH